ncbi:hypothetical protein K443DRAFT_8564 [Laccaria amethystina LaAM-08-1]|uniref:Unplaced genomic scaffold K443scaffold_116, whole genome shotgun sequence n=1 Tax=Laccaria amethystina LaAM-08-1 TaxID=1095629 RepID=A0A0C9XTF4_9AGAR|nr:hypothetical protein K443DRAFT_8564 [Laccaria amethystina LaAM-08-1]
MAQEIENQAQHPPQQRAVPTQQTMYENRKDNGSPKTYAKALRHLNHSTGWLTPDSRHRAALLSQSPLLTNFGQNHKQFLQDRLIPRQTRRKSNLYRLSPPTLADTRKSPLTASHI